LGLVLVLFQNVRAAQEMLRVYPEQNKHCNIYV